MRLVEVGDVPGGGLDPEAVGDAARGLLAAAGAVRDGGRDVAGAWAGLGASYEAPEAGALLRAMDPVRADTDRLGDELERVSAALARFAGELREIVGRCDRLRGEVREFRARVAAAPVGGVADVGPGSGFGGAGFSGSGFGVSSGLGLDPVLATENNLLAGRIAAVVEELAEAERACAAAVRSIDGWQERAGAFLLDTARGVVSDRLPWGEPGGAESCVGAAAEQVLVGVWNGVSFPAFVAAQPLLERLGGPSVSPEAQQMAWAEAGRSLIGWGVAQGEDLAGEIAAGFEPVGAWADQTTADVVGWSAEQVDALWLAGKDAVQWTGDRAQDASDWVVDVSEAVSDWVGDRADAIGDSWSDVGDGYSLVWDATGGSILAGRWPRTTEVVASVLQREGTLLAAAGSTISLGMWDVDLADDGAAAIGEPKLVPVDVDGTDGQPKLTSPENLQDLASSVSDAYGTGDQLGGGHIRVTTIAPISEVDVSRLIVSIPGTQPWFPWNDPGNSHPADLVGNLVTAGGGRSTMTESAILSIDRVIEDRDLGPDTEIMLVGHSQGGMTAAYLASDPEFLDRHHVTNVMTIGAPIDSVRIGTSVDVLEIQHFGDVVSELDLQDSAFVPGMFPGLPSDRPLDPAHHTKIVLPSPDPGSEVELGAMETLALNHSHQEYSTSIANNLSRTNLHGSNPLRGLHEYSQRIDGTFLTADSGRVRAFDVPIRRED